jgi:galactokinase
MASSIHTSLSHYFLLAYGFLPTRIFEVASRIFLLGEETLLEEGPYISLTSNIKSYGCVAIDPSPTITILSSGYPKVLINLDHLTSSIEPYSADFMVKILLLLLKEEKIILQGKAIFIDTSAPSKVMLSSSLSFAILILESLLDGQPTTLSLPQKTNILLRALKKGLNVSLNYLDVLSTLEGGLVFGEPTARDDGFIDHLPSTTLSPYKLVLIHLPLSPYLSSKSQQLWMKSFSSYRIMLQAPSLRLLNYEETLLQATKLTMQYGEKTMAPVFYFQEQQNRTKLAYFGLKNKNIHRFEEMMHQSFEAFSDTVGGLSFAANVDPRLETIVNYLKMQYPTIILKLLSKPFQGPLLLLIPTLLYKPIKQELIAKFYKKNIEDITLVNKTILSYKL